MSIQSAPLHNASIQERIQAEVTGHPIVLFMKGTPQFPMCGFSSRAVQALKGAGATQLHTVNVLEEPEIRANLRAIRIGRRSRSCSSTASSSAGATSRANSPSRASWRA